MEMYSKFKSGAHSKIETSQKRRANMGSVALLCLVLIIIFNPILILSLCRFNIGIRVLGTTTMPPILAQCIRIALEKYSKSG